MAAASSGDEAPPDNEDYYALLNVRRQVRIAGEGAATFPTTRFGAKGARLRRSQAWALGRAAEASETSQPGHTPNLGPPWLHFGNICY